MKRHKYGARAVVIDGVRFASQAEGRRYGELKMLEKAGEIYGLVLQPKFTLSVDNARYPLNCEVHGRSIDVGTYAADFRYTTRDGVEVIEDVKSKPTKTPVYRLKKKMVEALYGITITEVTRR